MHIGSRLFPYPILNSNQELSDYNENSAFRLTFDTDEEGKVVISNGQIVFKNLHYEIENSEIESLISNGKIRGSFIVECSASTFRKNYEITTEAKDLFVEARDLNGYVVVSAYLYATEDIAGLKNESYLSELQGYNFDIDKFDILAVDDGARFRIDLDPSEDDKVSSIFTIVRINSDDKYISYESKDSSIVIKLPNTYYDSYDRIKRKSDYNNIAFSMIAIPVLTACIEDVQEGYDDFDDLIESNRWVLSVCAAYKRETGSELDFDEFCNINSFRLSQMVLNYASCNGIEYFGEMLAGQTGEGGEDDE